MPGYNQKNSRTLPGLINVRRKIAGKVYVLRCTNALTIGKFAKMESSKSAIAINPRYKAPVTNYDQLMEHLLTCVLLEIVSSKNAEPAAVQAEFSKMRQACNADGIKSDLRKLLDGRMDQFALPQ